MIYPGVANDALSEATAISQLATSWQPAAVANPRIDKRYETIMAPLTRLYLYY